MDDIPGPFPSQPWCRGDHDWEGRTRRYCRVCGIDRRCTEEAELRRARKAAKAAAQYRTREGWGARRRVALAERDGSFCRYCGDRWVPLTVDHVVPRAKGGPNALSNCVLACQPCNGLKGARTPWEAGMVLLAPLTGRSDLAPFPGWALD